MAGSDLPGLGEFTYNGVAFPANREMESVECRPVYDAAQRTVTHTVYSLTVSFYVYASLPTADNNTDSQLNTLRNALLVPGGQLVFEDQGFGDFSINTSRVKDLMWGPKPEILLWEQKGSGKACKVRWKVTVAIKEGCANPLQEKAIMEFVLRIQTTTDREGYSRRVVSGYLRIPQTRKTVNERRLTDSADLYLEKFVPAPPAGFRRESVERSLSEDQCKLDVTVTDQQMPAAYPPPGIIDASASHTTRSRFGFVEWEHVISGSCTVMPNYGKSVAWAWFAALCKSRLRKQDVKSIVPVAINVSEPEIYGRRTATFALAYTTFLDGQNPQQMATAITRTQLWRPVPNSDYRLWAQSMYELGVWHPRGTAGLTYRPSDFLIIDLCLGNATPLPQTGATITAAQQGLLAAILSTQAPAPESSYIAYENSARLVARDEIIEQKLLPTEGNEVVLSTVAPGTSTVGGYHVPYISAPTSIIQTRAKPSVQIVMEGKALRAGYYISPPAIVSAAGQPAYPSNDPRLGDGFSSKIVANVGVPIVAASWRLRYTLPALPTTGFGPPPNVILTGPDDGNAVLTTGGGGTILTTGGGVGAGGGTVLTT